MHMRLRAGTLHALSIASMVCIAFLISGCAAAGNSGNDAQEITVVDMEGRSVTLNVPVEKIVLLESSKTLELAAIEGEDFTADKIVGWDNDFKVNAGDGYAKLLEEYPELADVPDVGSLDDNTFSVEKVISLKPDVVIMHNFEVFWEREATMDALAKLEQADIPVVFVDFYMEPLTNSTKSMLLLGKILGKEQRAQDIVDFYNEHVETVYSRLDEITDKKPSVYIEAAARGPVDYGISYGDVAWGVLVKKAGGDNIAEPILLNKSKSLSPEYLIDTNPDIIILTGRNWPTPGSLKLGYTISLEESKETMEAFINRPGWDTINAVKNHNVYAVYQGYCVSFFNFVGLEAFAKWFYPDEFQDVDPVETMKEFHEKFMPVDCSGTFVYNYYQ